MKTNTATMAMIIAMVAMIGMTGFAMAGSTTGTYVGDGSYDMNFDGTGTGYLSVFTYTSNGMDVLQTGWADTNVDGWQTMDTDSDSWEECTWSYTDIERSVTVGTGGTGQDSSGYIQTYTTDGGDNSVSSLATYHDDEAYGSYVATGQYVGIYNEDCDECNYSGVYGETDINGFAYGADTLVTGLVGAQSGSVSTLAVMEMTEGAFDLGTWADAWSDDCYWGDEAYLELYGTAEGDGIAQINGQSTGQANAEFDFGVNNDGLGYFASGNINGDPISVNFYDDFDTNYDATGYIYIVN